ncbi:hypothetical protein BSZ36_11575 [Rubricoccus marinus]|uniref:Cellobiose phosphorylase n=1 Tax=Rubricoccus marinus TaxID=716817 RepID=A0A259U4B1_9BACT|nr:hypothetical protein BSZ36_11575 [Rubricoccus marinus]
MGDRAVQRNAGAVRGEFVTVDGVESYRIENVDRMAPFFVSVVSDADHWLFASSLGSLSAGRHSPDHPLFPYETVDRIHDAQGQTGSKTLLLVTPEASGDGESAARARLWEPFSDRYAGVYRTRRSLTKSLQGDRLRFEETNDDLGLTFAVTWCTSERFGFVKRSELTAEAGARVRVLDGLQNLMPYGISREMQATRSVLTDAYKKNERVSGTTLGLFTLSAIPVDKAEPSEALKATVVWSVGLDPDTILLSSRQLDRFRTGQPLAPEDAVRAERGAYFIEATVELGGGESKSWETVADIEQDAADVIALVDLLSPEAGKLDYLRTAVAADVQAGTERLCRLAAGADAEQLTAEPMTTARHRMNVMFNIMRGGVFDEGYSLVRDDVRAYVAHHNRPLADAHADFFDSLPERVTVQALREDSRARGPQLERLCAAYLPLSFSRRHGDPSRPWNHFTIDLKNEDGSIKRGYEGNWRDIFQNWEALGRSYPEYLEGFIATFLGASTADGYNPYRITDEGIDWETIEPDDPWSYIGYWGDHQLIYLLRLLVLSGAHHPGRLDALLSRRRFSYANVPYRIKPYADLLRDPHDTVEFDAELEEEIERRVEAIGADGKLLQDASGDVLLVTLAEKLLVPLLAKLTNFIPEGGIWMNTQRPEWNDANNALVGYGVSMVTLFALRRYLDVLREILAPASGESVELSAEVADLLNAVSDAFGRFADRADRDLTDAERKEVVDALGEAGSAYRQRLYADGLSGDVREVPLSNVRALLDRAQAFADHTIAVNRREDGLYHAYNLMTASGDEIGVGHLYAMLEGQVAALDAGVLSPQASLDVLRALRASGIYRADQHSYRLYPDRELPSFLEKNNVPPEAVESSPLLQALLDAGDTSVVVRDVRGGVHFNGAFRNKTDLEVALDALRTGPHADLVAQEASGVLATFEEVFDHRAYTGRSGTFFGYEGLGSIYWHMVSKLALAAQETFLRAHDAGADAGTLDALAEAYYDIRAGLGGSKTPQAYGAFPTDAYSHTPGHAGAKQPGMTGQVKEDILCRWGELGVHIEGGRIVFRPSLLRADEFLTESATFHFVDVHGDAQTLALHAGSLAFTYCQVPVVYTRSEAPSLRLVAASGETTEVDGAALSPEASAEVFGRTGSIARIEVGLMPSLPSAA